MLNKRSLLSQFLHFSAATVASLMVFSLYSIVDGLFVARGVGEYAMSAVNLAVPFINLLFSIAVIFAVGTSTIIAYLLGQGNPQSANRLFSQNLVTLAVIGAIISILVMVFTFNAVQQMNEPDDPTYNEIRLLFEQEKVKYFSVEDNVLTLTLRGEGEDTSTLKYHLADFNVFYNDLHELIDSQRQAGIIQDYDYPAGWAEPWWFAYVPYLVILLGFGILQVGLSLKSHDPSQRSQGFLTLAGGLVVTFAKEILDLITA